MAAEKVENKTRQRQAMDTGPDGDNEYETSAGGDKWLPLKHSDNSAAYSAERFRYCRVQEGKRRNCLLRADGSRRLLRLLTR